MEEQPRQIKTRKSGETSNIKGQKCSEMGSSTKQARSGGTASRFRRPDRRPAISILLPSRAVI